MRKFTTSIFIVIIGLSFSACSLPEEIFTIKRQETSETTISAEEVAMASYDNSSLSEEELQMLEYEYLEETVGIAKEEYLALADIYKDLGFVKSERDILEKCFRLYEDEDVLERLSGIAVDITEESNVLQTLVASAKDESSIIELLDKDDFDEVFMPKLHDGVRTYFKVEGDRVVFLLEVGAKATKLLSLTEDNKGVAVTKDRYTTTLFSKDVKSSSDVFTFLSDSEETSYVKKTIDLYNGTVAIEEGKIKAGKSVGDYFVKTSQFDAYELKTNDVLSKLSDLKYDEYIGKFDENGKTIVEEPSEDVKASLKNAGVEKAVVYAYTADKKRCLFKKTDETENDFVFDSKFFNIPEMKKVSVYEIKDKSAYSTDIVKDKLQEKVQDVAADMPKVRVYDNEVQYFDGTKWVSCGTVETLAKQDPFEEYNNKPEVIETPAIEKKETVESVEIVEKKETVSSTPKTGKTGTGKAASKPASQPSVSVPQTPAVVAPVQPAPTEPSVTPSEPSHSDPEPSHSDPEPSTPSEPDPPAPSEPEPPAEESGDSDVEWGDDLL